jgi:hypothetical protein
MLGKFDAKVPTEDIFKPKIWTRARMKFVSLLMRLVNLAMLENVTVIGAMFPNHSFD